MEYASNIYLNLPLEIKFAAFYKYNGPLSSYSINDFGETESIEIDSYSILDLSISKSLFKNRMDLSLGSKNLFNIQNINITGNNSGTHQGSSSSNFVGYGISFFTSVKYKI